MVQTVHTMANVEFPKSKNDTFEIRQKHIFANINSDVS